MKGVILGGIILLGLSVQATIFSHLAFFGIRPDILLILVISFALVSGSDQGKWFGLAAGLVTDLFLTRLFGLQTLIKMLTGYWAGALSGKFFSDNLGIPMAVTVVVTGVQEIILYITSRLVGGLPWQFGSFVRTGLPRAIVYNLILAPWIYLWMSKITLRFRRRELSGGRATRHRQ